MLTEEQKKAARDRMAIARAAKKPKVETQPEVIMESNIVLDTNIASAKSAQSPAVNVPDKEIIWFTEVDYNNKGKVSSDFPCYYYDKSIKELKEAIRVLEQQLDDGVFTGIKKREAARNLSMKKDRYDKIINGTPKLEGKTKDKVVNSLKGLEESITESMFSYDSHWKQTADPHVVADRLSNPCIEIKDEVVASFARQRGMRMEGKKISQNDANIICKVMSKLLGKPTDVERLRPVRQHGITI
jgi:hypothetical protein